MDDYTPHIHEKKCLSKYYEAVLLGVKPFELRKEDDCTYADGDLLILREWREEEGYTGFVCVARVTYVLRDAEYLAPGYVALGIRVLK